MQSIMLCQLHQSPAWEAESLVMQGMISQVSDDAKQAIFGLLSQESFQNLSILTLSEQAQRTGGVHFHQPKRKRERFITPLPVENMDLG